MSVGKIGKARAKKLLNIIYFSCAVLEFMKYPNNISISIRLEYRILSVFVFG